MLKKKFLKTLENNFIWTCLHAKIMDGALSENINRTISRAFSHKLFSPISWNHKNVKNWYFKRYFEGLGMSVECGKLLVYYVL